MNTTKKLMTLMAMLLLGWLIPLDVSAANTTGDVNNDGEVSVADVNAVIDVILGGSSNTAAVVNNDGEISIADINVDIDIILGGGVPTTEDHEWVDLGLPSGTLWATRNIGATNPEGYGDHFAWGETSPKDSYQWSNYKWGDYSVQGGFSKYVTDNSYGTIDYKTELEPEDDAAYMNWGPSWRMPTREQLFELGQYGTWQSTSINGINGYLVTGPNGNTLFFPNAGFYDGSSDNYAGYFSFYWSSMLNGTTSSSACCTYSMSPNFSRNRYNGLPVRAVRVPQ